MGISQQIGASSIIKPGVCTSSTRPASPYEGQMIYETDTDLTYIYGGSAWQQVSGGTAVGNSGLVYVTSAAVGTAVSSVTVSSAFSSTYDNYRIFYTNGVSSATAIGISMKLGSLTAGYYSGIVNVSYATGAVTGTGQDNQSIWNNVGGSGLASYVNLDVDVYSPFLTRWSFFASRAIHYGSTFSTGNGLNTSATSITDFTLSPASGTLTGGTITVYGYRKA